MLYRNKIRNTICTDSKENDIYSNSSIQKITSRRRSSTLYSKNQPKPQQTDIPYINMNQRDPSTCPKDTLGTQEPRKYPTCPEPSQAIQERNTRQTRKLHTSRPQWEANHISLNIACNHCKPLFIPLLFLK